MDFNKSFSSEFKFTYVNSRLPSSTTNAAVSSSSHSQLPSSTTTNAAASSSHSHLPSTTTTTNVVASSSHSQLPTNADSSSYEEGFTGTNIEKAAMSIVQEREKIIEQLQKMKDSYQHEKKKWTLKVKRLEKMNNILEEIVALEVAKSNNYKDKLELAEKEIVDLKEQVEDLTHKLSAQNVQSGANSNVGNIDERGNEGCETVAFENVQNTESDYIRDLETFESDTDKGKRELSTLAKDVEVLGISYGLLLKVANEGYAGPELSGLQLDGRNEGYVAPEVSGPLVDGGNNGYVEPEVSGPLFDGAFAFRKVQNMESDHVTVPDLASVETDTDKNKRELSTLSKNVEILGKSIDASFTPLSCTTRSQNRGRRLKTALVPDQTGSQASNISKKLELTLMDLPGIIEPKDGKGRGRQESTTLKRKQDENSTLDATKFKVPRLNVCTTRSHTRGEKCVSRRRNQVEILKASVDTLTPILNPTTTRAHTRSLERQRKSNIAQTHSMDKQKTSLDIPKTSRVRRPVIEKKPEVTESRGRKRKPVDNIHSRGSKFVHF